MPKLSEVGSLIKNSVTALLPMVALGLIGAGRIDPEDHAIVAALVGGTVFVAHVPNAAKKILNR